MTKVCEIYNLDFVANPNDKVKSLVHDALNYLDTRTEFWRQQKPMYARKKESSNQVQKAVQSRNRQIINRRSDEYKERQEIIREKTQNPKAAGGYKPQNAEHKTPESKPIMYILFNLALKQKHKQWLILV
jgi:hypothetical protein